MKQRVAAAWQVEHAFEAQCQIEVAAGVEAALRESLEAREATFAQCKPCRGVGPDDHVGIAGGRGANGALRAAEANLPGATDVAQADLECRVEIVGGAKVAARQFGERLEGAP